MILIPLAKLQSVAPSKPQGYFEACIAAGTVVGDNLELSETAFAALRARFSPPPRTGQLGSFIGSVAAECGAVLNGEPSIGEEEAARRIAICEACEFFMVADRRCSKCGCWMEIKKHFRTATCPEGKWG